MHPKAQGYPVADSRDALLRDEIRSIVNRLDCDPDTITDDIMAAILTVLDEGATDEWRVCAGPTDAEFPTVFEDAVRSEEHLEIVLRDANKYWKGEAIWAQHRRVATTEWERVPS